MEKALLLAFFLSIGVLPTVAAENNDVDWQANWIWQAGDPQPRNFCLNARRTFAVQGEVVLALLHISADSRYRLYLNGQWLGDGPTRSFPHLQQFDTYDVTAQLQAQQNVLAVTANHYGESTFHYVLGRAGLLCQLEITYRNGHTEKILSDASWKVAPFTAYLRPSARISCQMPFEEIYDARQFAPDWAQLSFDDREWANAVEIGPAGTAPWTSMQPRTIPFLSRLPYYPTRIVSSRYVRPANLVETVNIKLSLLPNDKTANQNPYRGLIATEIISSVAQKAKLMRNYSIRKGPWYLNGKEISAPGKGETEIELRQGSNLFVADLIGSDHFQDFSLAIDAAAPISIRSPLNGRGKWLIIGPLDDDIEKARKQAKGLLTIQAMKKHPELLHFSDNQKDEAVVDVWNLIYSQTALPGKPTIQSPQAMLADNGNWTTIPANQPDMEILFDFGQELVGFTEFEIDAPEGAILDFHCFEAINDGVIQDTYGNRSSFRYVARNGLQHFVADWRRGFRYTAMTVRNLSAPLKIRYLRTLMSTYPAMERGSFQCSDERLNRIWKVGRHTLLCCMEDTFTDCPTYEQTFWVGDARNEALVCHAAFGEWPLVARCVRLVPQSLFRSKLPESQVPSGWQNILTAWSLLWIQMAHEYWWHSGDTATLEAVYPGIAQTLRACQELSANKWGLFSFRAWNMFDWAETDDNRDLVTHNNLFLVEALNRASDMAKALHKDADINEWQSFRQRLVNNINQYLWSEELSGYIDSIHNDGVSSKSVSQQTNTLALLYQVAPPERASRIATYTTSPPKGMIQFGSPFAMFYLLEELAKEGRYDVILDVTRDRWGFMLDAGTTTFWETFPGWEEGIPTRSHCHAWSAAPTYFLSHFQLGVAPLEPGFAKVLISPQPVDLSWAKGRVPTPHGEIEVNWQKSDSGFKLQLSLPQGVTGHVELPVDAKAHPELLVDGQAGAVGLSDKINAVTIEDNRWVVDVKPETAVEIAVK